MHSENQWRPRGHHLLSLQAKMQLVNNLTEESHTVFK